jgi:tol-pal system protein YbgF
VSAKRFLVEVTPYGSNTIRAEFNVAGLDQRIGDVQKACGWSAVASSGEKKKPTEETKKATEPKADAESQAVVDELTRDILADQINPPSKQAAGTTATFGTPDEQYQYAFSLLRQNKYDDAEKAFRAFIDQNPQHQLTGNANYWLGEIYYVSGDYKRAAITFAQGVKSYPQSGKAPDNMLKLGMALAAMGQPKDACLAFAQVGKRYPQASDALKERVTREQMRNGCA